jgi:hypothetical protein
VHQVIVKSGLVLLLTVGPMEVLQEMMFALLTAQGDKLMSRVLTTIKLSTFLLLLQAPS